MATEAYSGWAVVELFGHRQLAGRVSEVQQFGTSMIRIDVPKVGAPGEIHATQFYGGAAIFSVTPCDEATALRVAGYSQPDPTPLTHRLPGAGEEPDHDPDYDPDQERAKTIGEESPL